MLYTAARRHQTKKLVPNCRPIHSANKSGYTHKFRHNHRPSFHPSCWSKPVEPTHPALLTSQRNIGMEDLRYRRLLSGPLRFALHWHKTASRQRRMGSMYVLSGTCFCFRYQNSRFCWSHFAHNRSIGITDGTFRTYTITPSYSISSPYTISSP